MTKSGPIPTIVVDKPSEDNVNSNLHIKNNHKVHILFSQRVPVQTGMQVDVITTEVFSCKESVENNTFFIKFQNSNGANINNDSEIVRIEDLSSEVESDDDVPKYR